MIKQEVDKLLATYNMYTDEGKQGFADEVTRRTRTLANKLADAKLLKEGDAYRSEVSTDQLRVNQASMPKVTLELPDSMKETHSIVPYWHEWNQADNHMRIWIDVRKNK